MSEQSSRRRGETKLSPSERSLRARIAAYSKHAKYDPRESTVPARSAFLAKFEDEVDPNRELPEAEHIRRAESARRAYFTKLAYRSARARRQRVEGADDVA